MKQIILITFLLVSFKAFAVPSEQIPVLSNNALAASGTPEAVVASKLLVRSAKIYGNGANGGTIYLGSSAATATVTGVYLAAGGVIEFKIDHPSARIDLSKLYFDGTVTGDSISIFYME